MELKLEYSVLLCEAKGQAFILLLLDKQGSDKRQEVDHARPWVPLNCNCSNPIRSKFFTV